MRTLIRRLGLLAVLSSAGSLSLAQQTPTHTLQATLAPSDGPADSDFSERFGQAVAYDQNRILIGDAGAFDGQGLVRLYIRTDRGWREERSFAPPSHHQTFSFGSAVALAGDVAVIGAPRDGVDGPWTGAVYVLALDSTQPTLSRIGSPDPENVEYFGRAVATDGNRIAVGTSDNSTFVFEKSETEWSAIGRLQTPSQVLDVDIEGDYLVVGDGVGPYVFKYTAGAWSPPTPLFKDTESSGDSVTMEGNRIVVGSAGHSGSRGAAYVFERGLGDRWLERAQLAASDSAPFDGFGTSVTLEGDRIGVSAPAGLPDFPKDPLIYVYELDGTRWMETAIIPSPVGRQTDDFGSTLALTDRELLAGSRGQAFSFAIDGDWQPVWSFSAPQPFEHGRAVDVERGIVVAGAPGAPNASGLATGAVYVYEQNGVQWTELAKLSPEEGFAGDQFGTDVAIHDGRLAVGAPGDDSAGSEAGAVYIYEIKGGFWELEDKLIPSSSRGFGQQVALQGNRLVVGAPLEGAFEAVANTGAAYVFEHSDRGWTQAAYFRGLADNDFFGGAVALLDDVAFIGGPGVKLNDGYVQAIRRVGDEWRISQTIERPVPLGEADASQFGKAVAFAGSNALVASNGNGRHPASTYVYELVESGWVPISAIEGATSTFADSDGMVYTNKSIEIADDRFLNSVFAYSFENANTNWVLVDKVDDPAGDFPRSDGTGFGTAMAVDDVLLVVGASRALSSGARLGVVHVFSDVPVSTEPQRPLPLVHLSVVPNPSQETTSVFLSLPRTTTIQLDVYDILGRRVSRVHKGILGAGEHMKRLDLSLLGTGTYFLVGRADGQSHVEAFTIAR